MPLTLTDMFCGCGGSSSGASAVNDVRVQLAMNHWRLAVDNHNHNHPDTDHDCADISETHPGRYARTDGLIASPECTNHSLAKGARRTRLNQGDFFQSSINPAEVRSRATMWDVVRFAEHHRYEFIVTENVVDVRRWALYEPWLAAMHALGYAHKSVYLNAMFAHGPTIAGFAPQSRDRIYIVFWKRGNRAPDLDIRPKAPCLSCGCDVEAVQAWKPGRTWGKYKSQYVYRCPACAGVVTPYFYAALNALDLSLPGQRIGDRDRPLQPKTLARIEYGLKKYGLRHLVIRDLSTSGVGHRVRDAATAELPTQVGYGHGDSVLMPFLVETLYSHAPDDRARSGADVLPAQTTRASMAVALPFLQASRAGSPPHGVDGALHTITTSTSGEYVVSPEPFVVPLRSGRARAQGLNDVLATIVANGSNHMLIAPSALLTMRGPRHLSGIDDGLPAQVTTIQNAVVSSTAFLTSYYKNAQAARLSDAMPTVPTHDRHALAYAESLPVPSVEDLYFRMLQPHEMLAGQGFASDYVVLGSKRDQVKQIGNANPPPTMQLLVERCVQSLAA
ncbi:MAG: DNA cytosine methyltransferase [Rhodothermales bacterium]|nr:DNA cytosine methyltransferase [Rhodothermales bacterium]